MFIKMNATNNSPMDFGTLIKTLIFQNKLVLDSNKKFLFKKAFFLLYAISEQNARKFCVYIFCLQKRNIAK